MVLSITEDHHQALDDLYHHYDSQNDCSKATKHRSRGETEPFLILVFVLLAFFVVEPNALLEGIDVLELGR